MFHYVDRHLTLILLTNRDVEGDSFQVAIAQGIMAHLRPDIPPYLQGVNRTQLLAYRRNPEVIHTSG